MKDKTGEREMDQRIIGETSNLENYLTDLFGDDRPEIDMATILEGPEIIISEVMHVLELGKNRRAIGPDNIPTEALKLIDEERT
ncbi:hypothetical protein HHI36_014156 [Cryptolaemus montrouzieri]|uniref:Uncharacterized protein n=1 Tax=Cryptolaemus montrouzieri TaxID=559131 RepID=A0ABD2N2J4_9CUCU